MYPPLWLTTLLLSDDDPERVEAAEEDSDAIVAVSDSSAGVFPCVVSFGLLIVVHDLQEKLHGVISYST